jgi:SnoaL-like domain
MKTFPLAAASIAVIALVTGCTKESATAPTPAAALAPAPLPAEVAALVDRAAIENLYAEYYSHFGTDFLDFSQFFTQDGVLDVNGLVANGADQIKALYVRANGGTGEKPKSPKPSDPPPGKFHMQLTNLKVEVSGDSANVEAFWSSVLSATLIARPSITEYGREHAELVKQGGRWLIRKRVVTSYGGMPKGELKGYVPR